MKCTNCGNDFEGDFCPYCGAKKSKMDFTKQHSAGEAHETSKSNSEEIPTATEFVKDVADLYINWRIKFIWIGAIGAAILLMVSDMIVYGIIMMILGILIMPFMLKKYKKKWIIYALVLITILYAAFVAVEWESRPDKESSVSDAVQTQVSETNKPISNNITDSESNPVSSESPVHTASSAISTVPSEEPTTTPVQDEYIIPDSDVIKIDIGYLRGLTDRELMIARNEIYARHGRQFQTEWLQEYFNSCSWYTVNTKYNYDNEDSMLNAVELYNVKFITDYENSLK